VGAQKQTLQQQRAKHALEQIKTALQIYQNNKEHREKFVSTAENMPASILINGLGQSIATLRAQAKGKLQENPHMAIYYALQGWLCNNNIESPYPAAANLLEAIVEGDRRSYKHAQAESLAYLEWFKKFAVAFLKRPEE
jgi:CRISPR-associated protein Cmr5